MKLVSYEIATKLGRFERIGALAHGQVVDLTSAYTAVLGESGDAEAAKRHAEAVVPPDMIQFLEGGEASRSAAEQALAYAGQRLAQEATPRGPQGQRLTFDAG